MASRLCAAPGDLDVDYGGDGIVATSLASGTDEILAATLQSDGKLVCVGYASLSPAEFAVARFNLDGSPDISFSDDGRVFTAVAKGGGYGEAVAIQPDGKIVVAGYGHTGTNNDFVVVRYNTDGSLDPSFGTGGKVITPVGTGNDQCFGMALQPDGRIVAAGTSGLVRYMPDGSIDNSFGTGGKVVFPIDTRPGVGGKIVLQRDGKIVAANYRGTGPNDFDFAVARYGTNGALDSTFGSDGIVLTSFGSGIDYAWGIAIQPDQKIVVGGQAANGTNSDFAVVRYNGDGTLDTSFDGDGKVTFPIGGSNDVARCVALQGDGKVLLAGYAFVSNTYDFALARRNADGSADASFQGGVVTTAIGSLSDFGHAMLVQGDGKIIVAGDTLGPSGYDFAIARYQGGWSPPPDISVELPGRGAITNGGCSDLGYVALGTNVVWAFNVRNSGGTNLLGFSAAIGGSNAADFSVLPPPDTSLAPYQASQWVVTFTPGVAGDRSATLHIASNDPDENPFDIILRGTGITALEAWRLQHFGCISNSGIAADLFDPETDGIPNLMEFAIDSNPRQYGPVAATLTPDGAFLQFTYSRNKRAIGELTFVIEWSETLLADDWHTDDVNESILFDDGLMQRIQATLPIGSGPSRFVRVRVTRPSP